tara:strand:- start:220 stop:1515 length:1296 start_codon:yes stop_codon:yes gene_type:complete
MGRARQIASAENMDRILLDASAASTDEGEHLLLDGSAASTDVGFFINTEIGTTETPPEGFVNTSSIAADAIDNTKIADEAVKIANLAEEATDLTNRNVIINGSMNVHQRGPANQTGLGASSVYLIDRFELDVSTAARLTSSQADVTDLPGLTHALKLDCTTVDSSVAAGDLLHLRTTLEGQDVQHFRKGTAEAKGWVLSYYAKVDGAPKTGCVELVDSQNSRHVNANFTATNTWQRFVHYFPADTTGTLDNDNSDTIRVLWWLMAGSTYAGGSIQSSWASQSNTNRAVGTDNFFDNTSNNFFLTGIQLEAGDTLTAFEKEPPEKTLLKCQRYFYTPKAVGGAISENSTMGRLVSPAGNLNDFSGTVHFPVTMRADPTITITDSVEAGTNDTLGGLTTADSDIHGIHFVRTTNDSNAGRAALNIRGKADCDF